MPSESKRGCGYRQVGALYLEGGLSSAGCLMLPYRLMPCPVCSMGIKQARGWTWIVPDKYFTDVPEGCKRYKELKPGHHCKGRAQCPFNPPFREIRRGDGIDLVNTVALLWVGKRYYSLKSFEREALAMGVSKRINSIPDHLVLGETWVLLAHPEAVVLAADDPAYKGLGSKGPGIFRAFQPDHIAMPLWNSDINPDFSDWLLSVKGIKAVPIKDGDKAHAPSASCKRRVASLKKEYQRFKSNLDHWPGGT